MRRGGALSTCRSGRSCGCRSLTWSAGPEEEGREGGGGGRGGEGLERRTSQKVEKIGKERGEGWRRERVERRLGLGETEEK